jgi:hypothetical protein
MKALMIDEKDAKELYPTAAPVLENTFGKGFFNQKITDRVKTFEDASAVLGIDPDDIVHSADEADDQAYKKLKVIARALNEGWEPDYNNGGQRKWYPWFYLDSPGFRLFVVRYDYTDSAVGARLVFKTEELARYAATQFQGLYSDYLEL